MKKAFYIGLAAIFSISVAQAQQSVEPRTSNKAPESKERQRVESQPRMDSKIESSEKIKVKENGPRVSTSSKQSVAPQNERATRQSNEPSPRMEHKTYDRMTAEERAARIQELEHIIQQNEGNPDFNRAVYQKRIDLLQSPDNR
jgi:hypothetical protein